MALLRMALHRLALWLQQTRTLQRDLALRAGTTQSHISRFLNGHCRLSAEVAEALVRATEEIAREKGIAAVRVTFRDLMLHPPPSRRKRRPPSK